MKLKTGGTYEALPNSRCSNSKLSERANGLSTMPQGVGSQVQHKRNRAAHQKDAAASAVLSSKQISRGNVPKKKKPSRADLLACCKELDISQIIEIGKNGCVFQRDPSDASFKCLQTEVAMREDEIRLDAQKPRVSILKIYPQVIEDSLGFSLAIALSDGERRQARVRKEVRDGMAYQENLDIGVGLFVLDFKMPKKILTGAEHPYPNGDFQEITVSLDDFHFDEAEKCYVFGRQMAIVPVGQKTVSYHPKAVRIPVPQDEIVARTGLPENLVDFTREWLLERNLHLLNTSIGFYESVARFHDPRGFYSVPELMLYAAEDYAIAFRKQYREKGGWPQELVDVNASLKAVRAAVRLTKNVMEHKRLLRTAELATPILPTANGKALMFNPTSILS